MSTSPFLEEQNTSKYERNKELCIIANDIKSNIRNTTCECEYFENFYAKYDDINVYEL